MHAVLMLWTLCDSSSSVVYKFPHSHQGRPHRATVVYVAYDGYNVNVVLLQIPNMNVLLLQIY